MRSSWTAWPRRSASIRSKSRLRNFVQPEQMPYVSITKKTLDSGDYAAALKRAAELIDLPARSRASEEGRGRRPADRRRLRVVL